MSVRSKEDARVIKTKASVRKAFLELSAVRKISDISIKDISEAAGINRTTFYLHYKTIEDIYQDVINEHSRICADIIVRHKDEITDFDFQGCAEEFVAYYEKEFGVKEEYIGTGFVASLKRKVKNILMEAITELYKNTNMRDKYIVVSDEIISGLVYCFVSIISDWISSDRRTSLSKLCKEFRDVVLCGIKK